MDDNDVLKSMLYDKKLLKILKERALAQITEPIDKPFIKDGNGYLIQLTGGFITISDGKDFKISISANNLFEILKKTCITHK